MAYEKVLNAAWERGENLADGLQLAKGLLNRTFLTELGNVFVNVDGFRIETLAVSHFSPTTGVREVIKKQ